MSITSRDTAAASASPACQGGKAQEALALMVQALEMIDASEGAGVAGAHLDLAIHRLREWIDSEPPR